jgi:hypothetical protein
MYEQEGEEQIHIYVDVTFKIAHLTIKMPKCYLGKFSGKSLGTKYLSTYDDDINGRNKVLLFNGEDGLSLDKDDDDVKDDKLWC